MRVKRLFAGFIDALRLSRANNLGIIAATQYLTAACLLYPEQSAWSVLQDSSFFRLVISVVCVAAAGYYINDYFDIKIDWVNKPDRVIVGKHISRRSVMVAHATTNVVGILLGFWVSLWVGLIHALSAASLGWYSAHLKRLPLVGNLLVALLTATTLLVVLVYAQTFSGLVLMYAFFAFGMTMIREIIKDLEDRDGDARYGAHTLPVVMGIRPTKMILLFWVLLLLAALAYWLIRIQHTALLIYFSVLLIPFIHFVYLLVQSDRKRHFSFLSAYSKWFILAGMFSMVILKL